MRGQIKEITFLMKAQAEVCPGSAIGALQISGWEIIKLNLFDQERPWHVSGWRGKTLVHRSNRSLFLMQRWKKCVFFLVFFFLVSFLFGDAEIRMPAQGYGRPSSPWKRLCWCSATPRCFRQKCNFSTGQLPFGGAYSALDSSRSLALSLVPLGPFTTIVSSRFEL